jgi:hypothetical protein
MTALEAIFDLAINRASTTLLGLGLLGLGLHDPATQQATAALAEWHARTRFARRVPLSQVIERLKLRPQLGEWHWVGGPEGGWKAGRATFP